MHQLKAVHLRHLQIQQHQIGPRLSEDPGNLGGIGHDTYTRKAIVLEHPPQQQQVRLLVIHREDLHLLKSRLVLLHLSFPSFAGPPPWVPMPIGCPQPPLYPNWARSDSHRSRRKPSDEVPLELARSSGASTEPFSYGVAATPGLEPAGQIRVLRFAAMTSRKWGMSSGLVR